MICDQVHLAVLQFLTTSLPPFAPEIINGEILKKLLKLDVFRSTKNHPNSLEPVVKKGFPCDFFVLIIEGKVTESHVMLYDKNRWTSKLATKVTSLNLDPSPPLESRCF